MREASERVAASGRDPGGYGAGGSRGLDHPDAVWWTDARNDPWRDPATQTEIVVPAPPSARAPTPLEPVGHPNTADPPRTGRILPAVVIIAVLVGVVAGALGGALGYTYAARTEPSGALGAGPGTAPAGLALRPPETLAGVVEQVLPSVVTIRADGLGGTSLGSGFVVSSEGYVLTNDHVLGSGSAASVTFHDGSTTSAQLIGRDHESDLAVLRVERPGQVPVQLGDSESLAVGDPVLAFGSPLALANTVTSGIVSAIDRTIRSGEPGGATRYYAAIQTDAAVNQGNSGGPLVDAAGRVIGVNSVIRSVAAVENEAANIGLAFAIPINQAKRVAQEIIDTGQARRTVLGAELEPAGRVASGGVRLSAVVPDGPADKGGLRQGDVVVRFDGRSLEEPADLIALVRKHAPGAVVTVEYRRGSSSSHATVTLAADTG